MPVTLKYKKTPKPPNNGHAKKVAAPLPAIAKGPVGHAAPAPKEFGGSTSGSPTNAGQPKMHDLTAEENEIRERLRSRRNRQEAAAYLSDLGYPITANLLSKLAVDGSGPEYTKFGKMVFYYPDVLLAWAKAREQVVTGKHGAGHLQK
jgi:hypothetical protein